CQTPRLLNCVGQLRLVWVKSLIRGKGWKWCVLVVNVREGISARNIRVRIAEIQRPVQAKPYHKRRDAGTVLERKRLEEIMGNAATNPDHRLSIAGWVECQTDARLK